MNRRKLLTLGGASITGCFAGCLGGLGGGGGREGDQDTTDEEATGKKTTGEGRKKKTNGEVTESTEPEGGETESADRDSDVGFTIGEDFAIVASYPVETANGTEYERQTVFTEGDFVDVGDIRDGRDSQQASIPVTPSDEAAERFVDVTNENGFTDEGVGSCRWRETPDDPGWCLYTVVDGEITYAAAMGNGLATAIRSGDYLQNPSFVLRAGSRSEAEELRERLVNDAEETEEAEEETETGETEEEEEG